MDSRLTRYNNPLFLALREIYGLPVVDHGYLLKTRDADTEEDDILYASYREGKWNKQCPLDVECRLQEREAYVQYGGKTLKIDLVTPHESTHERRVIEVPSEEFPACRRRENREPGEYSILGHDSTGTEEWTWKWAEGKLTKEERKVQLADYIGTTIPEIWGLETYRLCEISNVDHSEVKRYLTTDFTHRRGINLLCGDFVTQDVESNLRLLSSGQGPQNANYFGGKILGFYSGNFLNSYALCYTPEGFNIVHFRMVKVDARV